ncbi:CinA family protein [Chryseobacterium foetidum]|uniref:CinA family protein n=1 Tax=Chryseobacterium foetidum TaxID=2951057 RepID=UPI0021C6D3EE|nr:nicotinamide-nucleotide amidohydrolase family protein [Chryseobacterium foetidum]
MEIERNLLYEVANLLKNSKETVSVAESVTSGYLQYSFSQMADASKYYHGGITAYTLEKKVKFLNINSEEAEKCDCVSDKIAEEMARNIAKSFETDWGIAVTGYSTPVEESDFKIYAYFSFSHKDEIVFTKKLELHPRTNQQNAQIYYCEFILGCFKTKLSELQSE